MPRFRIIVEISASCMEAAQAVAWELAGGQVGNPCEIKRLWDLETEGYKVDSTAKNSESEKVTK